MSLTVVMPTIGRVSIAAALKSVLSQNYPILEILIVDSSALGIPEIETKISPIVRVIRNNKTATGEVPTWTAAHNRNLGILEAKGTYLALIDDDDEWLPNKLEIQMSKIAGRTDVLSTTSVIFRMSEAKAFIRPRKLLQNQDSYLKCVYGKVNFSRSSYYIATPTVIIPTEVARNVLFDESLSWFEDTWWYHNLEIAGLRHEQIEEPLTIVNADPSRSIRRDSVSKNLEWANRISSVNRRYGSNYLFGIAIRNAVWLRRWSHLFPLFHHALRIKFRKTSH